MEVKSKKELQTILLQIHDMAKSLNPSSLTLDVGCASGELLSLLHTEFHIPKKNLYGIDISNEAIQKAQLTFKNIYKEDILSFNPNCTFSVVFVLDVIEHIQDSSKLFNSLKQLVSKGGMLVISTPNFDSLSRFFLRKSWFGYTDPTHCKYYTLSRLKHELKQNSFEIIQTKTLSNSANIIYNKLISATQLGGQILVVCKRV